MVPYTKVVNGLSKYIDEEIVNKMAGLNKWVIGAVAETVLKLSIFPAFEILYY